MITRHKVDLNSSHCLIVEIIMTVLKGDRQLGPISDMAKFNFGTKQVGVRQPRKNLDALLRKS
jgi:hypothetical protein